MRIGDEAEKYWKVQRDRYGKEKKKIKTSKVSGAGAVDVYVPKWTLYKILDSFLAGVSSISNT